MSLYDDVVTDFGTTNKTEVPSDTASNWSSNNFKLMQMQVEAAKKRQSLSKIKPAFAQKRDKPAYSIAPVIDLSDKRGKPQLQLSKDVEPTIKALSQQNFSSSYTPVQPNNHSSSTGDVRFNSITGKIERQETTSIYSNSTEEYDPMQPNDYDQIMGETSKASKNKENQGNNSGPKRDRSRDRKHSRDRRRRKSRSRSRSRRRDRSRDNKKKSKRRSNYSSSSEDSDSYSRKRKRDDRNGSSGKSQTEASSKTPNNAFAPPPSLLEDNAPSSLDEIKKPENPLPAKSLFGSLKAEKMMAKMGYKEGDGLGRNKQGMSIALQVEKTGKRSGRIIHENDVSVEPPPVITPMEPIPPPAAAPVVGIPAEVMKNMSKVVLLRNMVGPGDIDEDLEDETKEECSKYGEVNKCVIYEIPGQVPEEAVRIFLEFKTLPSAIKALTDLNGRFFGGRSVKATFYNFDKFKQLKLNE